MRPKPYLVRAAEICVVPSCWQVKRRRPLGLLRNAWRQLTEVEKKRGGCYVSKARGFAHCYSPVAN